MGETIPNLFAIHQVCALTGFSKHMLDYLEREEIFVSSGNQSKGRGVRRLYTYSDVVLLRALKGICDDAGRIRHLKKALLAFKERYGSMKPGALLSEFLVAKGGKLYIREGDSVVEEALSGQRAFSFVVDMARVTRSVSAQIIVIDESKCMLRYRAQAKAEEIRERHWSPIRRRRESAA